MSPLYRNYHVPIAPFSTVLFWYLDNILQRVLAAIWKGLTRVIHKIPNDHCPSDDPPYTPQLLARVQ